MRERFCLELYFLPLHSSSFLPCQSHFYAPLTRLVLLDRRRRRLLLNLLSSRPRTTRTSDRRTPLSLLSLPDLPLTNIPTAMRLYLTETKPHCVVLEETGFHLVFLPTHSSFSEPSVGVAVWAPGEHYPHGEQEGAMNDIAGCLGLLRFEGSESMLCFPFCTLADPVTYREPSPRRQITSRISRSRRGVSTSRARPLVRPRRTQTDLALLSPTQQSPPIRSLLPQQDL